VAKEEQFSKKGMGSEFGGDLLIVVDFDGENGLRTWSSSIVQFGCEGW
jgi:hypothetical protein